MRIVGEGLCKLVEGARFCREEELTRDCSGCAAGVLEIAGRNQRGEGLGGDDCAEDGWGELWSDVGGGMCVL